MYCMTASWFYGWFWTVGSRGLFGELRTRVGCRKRPTCCLIRSDGWWWVVGAIRLWNGHVERELPAPCFQWGRGIRVPVVVDRMPIIQTMEWRFRSGVITVGISLLHVITGLDGLKQEGRKISYQIYDQISFNNSYDNKSMTLRYWDGARAWSPAIDAVGSCA